MLQRNHLIIALAFFSAMTAFSAIILCYVATSFPLLTWNF